MKHTFSLGFREARLLGFAEAQGPEAPKPEVEAPKAEQGVEKIEDVDSVDTAVKKAESKVAVASNVSKLADDQVSKIAKDSEAAAGVEIKVEKENVPVKGKEKTSASWNENGPIVQEAEKATLTPVDDGNNEAPTEKDAKKIVEEGKEKIKKPASKEGVPAQPEKVAEEPKTKSEVLMADVKDQIKVLADKNAPLEKKFAAFMVAMAKFSEYLKSFANGTYNAPIEGETKGPDAPAGKPGENKDTKNAPAEGNETNKNERRDRLKDELKKKGTIQELIDEKKNTADKSQADLTKQIDQYESETDQLDEENDGMKQQIKDFETGIVTADNDETKSMLQHEVDILKVKIKANDEIIALKNAKRAELVDKLKASADEPKKDIEELTKMKNDLDGHAAKTQEAIKLFSENAPEEFKDIFAGITVEKDEKNYTVNLKLSPEAVQKITDLSKQYGVQIESLGISKDNLVVKKPEELMKVLQLIADKMKETQTKKPEEKVQPAGEKPTEAPTAEPKAAPSETPPASEPTSVPEAPADEPTPATPEQPVEAESKTLDEATATKQASVLLENLQARMLVGLEAGNPEFDQSLQELTDYIRSYRQQGGNETESGRVIAENLVKNFNETNKDRGVELSFDGESFAVEKVGYTLPEVSPTEEPKQTPDIAKNTASGPDAAINKNVV